MSTPAERIDAISRFVVPHFAAGVALNSKDASKSRYAEVSAEQYPRRLGALSLLMSLKDTTCSLERAAQRLLLKFRKALPPLLIELPTAGFAFDISVAYRKGFDEHDIPEDRRALIEQWSGVYIVSLRFGRATLWCCRALICEGGSHGHGLVRLQNPLEPMALCRVVEKLLGCCFSDDCKKMTYIMISALKLSWDLHKLYDASIIDQDLVCTTLRLRKPADYEVLPHHDDENGQIVSCRRPGRRANLMWLRYRITYAKLIEKLNGYDLALSLIHI